LIRLIYCTGKPAKLSSTHKPDKYYASKAVDGIYTEPEDESSMAHSRHERRPWWRVDLVDIHCVWAVNILNRVNGMLYTCFNELINVVNKKFQFKICLFSI